MKTRFGILTIILPAAALAWGGCATLGLTPQPAAVAPQPAAQAPAVKVAAPLVQPTGPLELTLAEALLLSLENNKALLVQRHQPSLAKLREDAALGPFDPLLSGSLGLTWRDAPAATGSFTDVNAQTLTLSAAKLFPLGTQIEGGAQLDAETGTDSTRLYFTLTQPVLRGFGTDVNLATLYEARIDTRISEYELRGFAEAQVAQVEKAYWDFHQAKLNIEIVERSYALAERQLEETRERVKAGKLAEIETVAAEAEVASRKVNLIDAKSSLEQTRLLLIRLLSPPGINPWDRLIVPRDAPTLPPSPIGTTADHVAAAMNFRPDLNEARLRLDKGNLEVVRTRNGLLPKLDLFLTLGKTGYADSFGETVPNVFKRGSDVTLGANMSFPWHNIAATADSRTAFLSLAQAREALANQEQLAETDVRTALVDSDRLRQQIDATAAVRKLKLENLRAEQEKFRVGRSTSFVVAQAERDALQAEIDEVQALVNYLKSLTDLWLLEGTLLEKRGLAAPGAIPLPAK